MKITKLHSTCSMLELGGLGAILPTGFNKEYIKERIKSQLNETEGYFRGKRNIIANVNYKQTRTLYKELSKIGFKTVHTYQGNSGAVAVMILDLNKKTWREKIISWLS